MAATWALAKAVFGSGGVSGLRTIIERAEEEVASLGDLIPAGAHAVERLDTAPPGGGVNVMLRQMPWRQKTKVLPMMWQVINSVVQCGAYMKDDLVPTRSSADEGVWKAIHALAKKNGAVEVGFARTSEHDIFKNFAVPYRNAIVFTIDMKKEAMDTAPSYDALMEVARTYSALGKVALVLTDYLREHGYGAYPGFPLGGIVDYVRVAAQAGVGALGYHGMLISPADGTRQRINVVFTNMEIPEPSPNPHEWILDFCAMCQKCVRRCPPQAIFTTAQVDSVTGRKPTVHYQQCVDYFGKNQGCAVCLAVCPFSQVGYDVVKERFKGNPEAPQLRIPMEPLEVST